MPDDRLIIHTVHTDDGATELYFGRASDDFAGSPAGSMLFHPDDSVTYKMWTSNEEPVVVCIKHNRVVVLHGEDQVGMDEAVKDGPLRHTIVFDSDSISEGG